jgi:hypothetical protein
MSETEHQSKETAMGKRQWLLAALMLAVVLLSSFSTVDRYAEQEYESLFERALITFALARTLNGVISAVQGTELALQPAGVGVTLTPGEVLDPVNDLVERFSWIMLGATLSLGVQQILLDIGQWWGMKLLVAMLCLGWLWYAWRRRPVEERDRLRLDRFLVRALVVVLFLRFAVPLAMIANEAVYALFLESKYQESTQVIEAAGAELEQVTVEPDLPEEGEVGILESIGRTFSSTADSFDFEDKLDEISERASELIEHLLQLSVVFIFQTGILPIAFLWLFLRSLSLLLRPPR